jgi:hypothetical protein
MLPLHEELVPLEKKFIQFLVANTITGEDWALMKERRPEQAMGLVDIFSDLMFYEAMKKVEYLIHAEPKSLKIFHCQTDTIELIGLNANENTTIDFTKNGNWFKEYTEGALSFFTTEKKYTESREVEIFKMIENSCRITDSFLHDTILNMYKLNNQN